MAENVKPESILSTSSNEPENKSVDKSPSKKESEKDDNSFEKESDDTSSGVSEGSEEKSSSLEDTESSTKLDNTDSEKDETNSSSTTNEDSKDISGDVPADIIQSVRSLKRKSVLERYYEVMYCMSIDETPIDDHCLLFHSNKICLLTIAPSHPIIRTNKTILQINYNVEGDINRMKNKVTGKGKKGGQKLMPNTLVCQVECCDGTNYQIYSCIKGKLIEMNPNLARDPNLLLGKPKTEGHIAVLLSDLSTIEIHKKGMLSEQDYEEYYNKLPKKKVKI